mgnify:CR=1 FL=1
MPESPKGEEHLITVIETELHSQPHETLEVVVTEECIESPVKKIRKEEIGTIFVSNHINHIHSDTLKQLIPCCVYVSSSFVKPITQNKSWGMLKLSLYRFLVKGR